MAGLPEILPTEYWGCRLDELQRNVRLRESRARIVQDCLAFVVGLISEISVEAAIQPRQAPKQTLTMCRSKVPIFP